MRLYCQQGFSSRIVQALGICLERTLRMAAEEGPLSWRQQPNPFQRTWR